MILACFLVQEGANTEIRNKKGMSALHMSMSEHAYAIAQYIGPKGYVHICAYKHIIYYSYIPGYYEN